MCRSELVVHESDVREFRPNESFSVPFVALGAHSIPDVSRKRGVKRGPAGVRSIRLSSNTRITSRNKCHVAILIT